MSLPESAQTVAGRPSPMTWLTALAVVTAMTDIVLGIDAVSALFESGIVLLAGYLGVRLIPRAGLPLWSRRISNQPARYALWAVAAISVAFNWWYSGWRPMKLGLAPPALIAQLDTTVVRGVTMCIRAAITEEVLFRLLLGSLVMLALQALTARMPRWTRPLGIAVTGLGFCLLVHRNVAGLLCGIAVSYVYFEAGLVPVMIVHFLADFVPYGLIIPLLHR